MDDLLDSTALVAFLASQFLLDYCIRFAHCFSGGKDKPCGTDGHRCRSCIEYAKRRCPSPFRAGTG